MVPRASKLLAAGQAIRLLNHVPVMIDKSQNLPRLYIVSNLEQKTFGRFLASQITGMDLEIELVWRVDGQVQ